MNIFDSPIPTDLIGNKIAIDIGEDNSDKIIEVDDGRICIELSDYERPRSYVLCSLLSTRGISEVFDLSTETLYTHSAFDSQSVMSSDEYEIVEFDSMRCSVNDMARVDPQDDSVVSLIE
jgi:hypothetical protein